MTLQEAERLANLWCAGQPPEDLPQWRTVMQTILRELDIARHQCRVKIANAEEAQSK